MAKVEAGSTKEGIQISQLPLYNNPEPRKYEEVDHAGEITRTLRGWVSPLTRAILPGMKYVKAGSERAKEIGQTGYAHTMTSVQMIEDDPYGPASIVGGAAGGLLLGIRGGKITKALLAISGAALGGYIYYWEPQNKAGEIFDKIKKSVEDLSFTTEKKSAPETKPSTEAKKDS
ncbi:uncharacterized protein LOC132557229 [Ylistrum balloti]|uniref:uncharacterized protein LOC132557229 n=1 Tax=Ylistrum balloti TaxID=509963 RepID=UPI002905A202|nr:uncharacterized protein LOC132557229 [Ylistrum balloti]